MDYDMTGCFASYVKEVLSPKDYYQSYMRGDISSAQFRDAMLADASLAELPGFFESNIERIALAPIDEKLPAEAIVKDLTDQGIIPACDIMDLYEGFDEYRKHVHANYDHDEFLTSISPEDERLLYAMAALRRPKRVFVAGSYYGYFTVWAMKAVSEQGGMCVLSDVDEEVCELARKNFGSLGFGAYADIRCEDAESLLQRRTQPIDLLVLDATGDHSDSRLAYRGKRIYGALLKDAEHLLAKGSMIVIHNMEPENPDMQALVAELRAINALGTSYDTYNGLGVYIVI